MRYAAWSAGLFVLILGALLFLREPFYGYVWHLRSVGFLAVLPTTCSAALRVWAFWGVAGAVIAELLLRADPEIGLFDAIFGGALGVWMFAYLLGNLIGPLPLFRTSVVWLVLLAALIEVWREPAHVEFHAPSTAIRLALLACALMAIGVLPMQLGSPVPPYMDTLNNPASAQRVVTFHRYLPLDNDPYGHWSPGVQTPGLELFYALLAVGSASPLAVLAETAATLPMMCLIIFAAWRLERTLIDESVAGMAALLLFATTIFMRGIQMRGTAVSFVLVAGGLGFFLDRERRPLRTGFGAIMLGTAFASHSIVAALGFTAAVVALTVQLFDRDFGNVFWEAMCLAGAILIAVPEFAVALVIRLPYPILPACQFTGIALICLAARRITASPAVSSITHWLRRGLLIASFMLFAFCSGMSTSGIRDSFPMLGLLCMGGLLLAALDYRHSDGAWLAAVALMIPTVVEYAIGPALRIFPSQQMQFGLNDIVFKLQEYWLPYFLVFPAAVLFDWAYRHLSRTVAVAVLLGLVVFPWTDRSRLDINYYEHPLVDQWAVNWQTAKTGWWGDSPDHRWLQSPDEFALIDKIRDEIDAGRVTAATHVIHVAPESIAWKDELLYSLYTGIDDDIYVVKPEESLGKGDTAQSRMHPAKLLPAAMRERPPYLVVYRQATPQGMTLPPPGYDEIFHRGDIRLFRLRR
jgi:hypothetical protein